MSLAGLLGAGGESWLARSLRASARALVAGLGLQLAAPVPLPADPSLRLTPASLHLERTPWTPNEMGDAVLRSGLGSHARHVYHVLLRHFNHGRRDAFPGLRCIARETGLDKAQVVRAIAELERHGWIKVRRRMRCWQRAIGEPSSNLYTFDHFPIIDATDEDEQENDRDDLAAIRWNPTPQVQEDVEAPSDVARPRPVFPPQLPLEFAPRPAHRPDPSAPAQGDASRRPPTTARPSQDRDASPADGSTLCPEAAEILSSLSSLPTLAALASPKYCSLLWGAARRKHPTTAARDVLAALADAAEVAEARALAGNPLPSVELSELVLRYVRVAGEPKRTKRAEASSLQPRGNWLPESRLALGDDRRHAERQRAEHQRLVQEALAPAAQPTVAQLAEHRAFAARLAGLTPKDPRPDEPDERARPSRAPP